MKQFTICILHIRRGFHCQYFPLLTFLYYNFECGNLLASSSLSVPLFSLCICASFSMFVIFVHTVPFLSCFTLQSRESAWLPPAGTAQQNINDLGMIRGGGSCQLQQQVSQGEKRRPFSRIQFQAFLFLFSKQTQS